MPDSRSPDFGQQRGQTLIPLLQTPHEFLQPMLLIYDPSHVSRQLFEVASFYPSTRIRWDATRRSADHATRRMPKTYLVNPMKIIILCASEFSPECAMGRQHFLDFLECTTLDSHKRTVCADVLITLSYAQYVGLSPHRVVSSCPRRNAGGREFNTLHLSWISAFDATYSS